MTALLLIIKQLQLLRTVQCDRDLFLVYVGAISKCSSMNAFICDTFYIDLYFTFVLKTHPET